MENHFLEICLIVVCGALLGWLACRCRQPILVGYFVCGMLIGPWGLGLVQNTALLDHVSRIGITLLLFLAGLVLHPERLAKFYRVALIVTVGGCAASFFFVFGFTALWRFDVSDCIVAALALMFSSTILAVKLLPTSTLHQRRMGGICIAVLIAQDILAIALIMFVGLHPGESMGQFLLVLHVKAILLVALTLAVERYLLRAMMRSVDRFNEVLIMLCLAWCLGIAALAEYVGLSYEIGAFIAGVVMARGKIAYVFSEQLKPLRDFFLLFFFFLLGAEFDLLLAQTVWMPALLLSVLIVVLRPIYLRWLCCGAGEPRPFAREMGVRLGQSSEFALIVAIVALQSGKLGPEAAQLVQLTTILTMLMSSYIVVLKYPSPLGTTAGLKQD